jgi:hypothetical protein
MCGTVVSFLFCGIKVIFKRAVAIIDAIGYGFVFTLSHLRDPVFEKGTPCSTVLFLAMFQHPPAISNEDLDM